MQAIRQLVQFCDPGIVSSIELFKLTFKLNLSLGLCQLFGWSVEKAVNANRNANHYYEQREHAYQSR